MRASVRYGESSGIGRCIAWALALALGLPLTVVAVPQVADAQCTHGVAIFKSCQGPRRSCATDADCPDTECTDGVCDTNLDNVTNCTLTLTHADTCGDTTKITEAFDKQDFGGDNVRVPAVGSLPISGIFGNAVCCAGPALPCFVGPAGSVAAIGAGETGCGALALPGAGTAGSVSFVQNTYVVQPNDPDPLPDQANITVKDLCDVFPAGCSSGLSTVQFTAATDILDSDGCFSVNKSASTPCTDNDGNVCTVAGCDGLGSCDQSHVTPDSTPCPGQPTECASPGCDGAGNCDPLHFPVPPSTPCTDNDGNVCTVAGCDGLGACDQAHILPDSIPCPGQPTECASPGCDGAGNCDPLHVPEPPSTPCTDNDGNVCTIAGCDGLGACDQSHITPDSTPCPDQGNECAAAGCDGAGNCDQLHVPAPDSTPCTDNDGNVCTVAGCNGQGTCDQQHTPAPDSTPCPDTENECAEAGCDGAGTCDQQHLPVQDSTPCTDTDGDLCTTAGCDGLGTCDQQHITDPDPDCGGDHYKCYKSRAPFTQRDASLVDQFGSSTATVVRVERFCNPVNKNNEGINDPLAHLNCYRIREPRGPARDVVVNNQFGEQRLTSTRANSLCVPAIKDQVGNLDDLDINHYKCYRVRRTAGEPKFTQRDVQLVDQFENKNTTVVRPSLLCNPVNKNGEGVPAPGSHLVCYRIRDVRGQTPFVPQQPNVTDQFVVQDLQTTRRTDCSKTRLLCVPSSKRIASPSGAFLDGGAGLL
jgi:hypothetical protein